MGEENEWLLEPVANTVVDYFNAVCDAEDISVNCTGSMKNCRIDIWVRDKEVMPCLVENVQDAFDELKYQHPDVIVRSITFHEEEDESDFSDDDEDIFDDTADAAEEDFDEEEDDFDDDDDDYLTTRRKPVQPDLSLYETPDGEDPLDAVNIDSAEHQYREEGLDIVSHDALDDGDDEFNEVGGPDEYEPDDDDLKELYGVNDDEEDDRG